jgi:hypothetical protein
LFYTCLYSLPTIFQRTGEQNDNNFKRIEEHKTTHTIEKFIRSEENNGWTQSEKSAAK